MSYQCPDCGGRMHTTARMSDPPVYEAKCSDCAVLYRRRHVTEAQLPREYERIGRATPAAQREG